jgi:Domain of unknown function (DUF5615)
LSESIKDVKSPVILSKNTSFDIHPIANSYKTTAGLGRTGLTDEEQLAFASEKGRVIYTIDQDFLRLARECLEQGRSFAGIAYHGPGERSKREIIEALLMMHAVFDSEDMQNRVEFI